MLGENLLPSMPRPLSFWFGMCSSSIGALGCVYVLVLMFLSLVYRLMSLSGARSLRELVLLLFFFLWVCSCSLVQSQGGVGCEAAGYWHKVA